MTNHLYLFESIRSKVNNALELFKANKAEEKVKEAEKLNKKKHKKKLWETKRNSIYT